MFALLRGHRAISSQTRSAQHLFETRSSPGAQAHETSTRPEDVEFRRDLALAYRLSSWFEWEELIYNHITCKVNSNDQKERFLINPKKSELVPKSMIEFGWEQLIYNGITCKVNYGDGKKRFFVNPYGMGFDEVTASSLVTIDRDGNVLHPGNATGRVNCAGFLIHSAVHCAREDAKCVIHIHQGDVVAVGARPEGLIPVGQAYYALGEVTVHDYEGLALLEGEKKRLVQDLGPSSKVMMLRNHGSLTLGSSIAEAMIKTYFLVRACQQQVKAGPTALLPQKSVQELATDQALAFNSEGFGKLEFACLKRKYERLFGDGYRA